MRKQFCREKHTDYTSIVYLFGATKDGAKISESTLGHHLSSCNMLLIHMFMSHVECWSSKYHQYNLFIRQSRVEFIAYYSKENHHFDRALVVTRRKKVGLYRRFAVSFEVDRSLGAQLRLGKDHDFTI